MMCKMMCAKKAYVGMVLIVALILGILEALLPAHELEIVLIFQKGFTGMLPVLGVGSLVKYLLCGASRNSN